MLLFESTRLCAIYANRNGVNLMKTSLTWHNRQQKCHFGQRLDDVACTPRAITPVRGTGGVTG
jgi:hypothetical protein